MQVGLRGGIKSLFPSGSSSTPGFGFIGKSGVGSSSPFKGGSPSVQFLEGVSFLGGSSFLSIFGIVLGIVIAVFYNLLFNPNNILLWVLNIHRYKEKQIIT